MCNDFGNNIPYHAYLEAFSETRIPVRFPQAPPNLEPRDDIWPTDTAPVIRQVNGDIEFAQLRWGFPPGRPTGAPIINLRSEGRRFPKGRCIPASHFFEFTGSKSPKSKVAVHQGRRGLVLLRRAVASRDGMCPKPWSSGAWPAFGADRSQQFLRAGRGAGDCPVRLPVRRGARHGGRCLDRGAGDALGRPDRAAVARLVRARMTPGRLRDRRGVVVSTLGITQTLSWAST